MTRDDCYKSLLNTKVFVKDRSSSIQCILFSLGFEWNGGRSCSSLVRRTDAPFLFISEDGKITCSNSTNHFYSMNNKEVSAEYILSIKYIDEELSVPYLSPWISVKDDLPCNHKELLLSTGYHTVTVFTYKKGGACGIDNMIIRNGKWEWEAWKENYLYWMPIPNLPK